MDYEEIIENILIDISKDLSENKIIGIRQKINDTKEDLKKRREEKDSIEKRIEDIEFVLENIKGNNDILEFILNERKETLREQIDNLNIERQEKRLKESEKYYNKFIHLRKLFDLICEKRDTWHL